MVHVNREVVIKFLKSYLKRNQDLLFSLEKSCHDIKRFDSASITHFQHI